MLSLEHLGGAIWILNLQLMLQIIFIHISLPNLQQLLYLASLPILSSSIISIIPDKMSIDNVPDPRNDTPIPLPPRDCIQSIELEPKLVQAEVPTKMIATCSSAGSQSHAPTAREVSFSAESTVIPAAQLRISSSPIFTLLLYRFQPQ